MMLSASCLLTESIARDLSEVRAMMTFDLEAGIIAEMHPKDPKTS
jgi:hypothetical protein